MFSKLKNVMLATVAIAAFAGFTYTGAQAANIESLLFRNTQFEDTSGESMNVDLNGNGNLDVGDSLRGILRIDFLRNLDNLAEEHSLAPGSGNNELAAVFEATVIAKVDLGGGLFNFVFGPSASFATEMEGITGMAAGSLAGTMVAFFEDPTHEFKLEGATCTSTAPGGNCEGNITDGTLVLAAGMVGGAGEGWVALGAPETPSVLTTRSVNGSFGTFNVALSEVFSVWNLEDGIIGGSGALHGSCDLVSPFAIESPCSDPVSPYHVIDDVRFAAAVVPEPGTLSLMSLGLLGLGAAVRRRRKAA